MVNHLLWAYLGLNLTVLAREILSNIEEFNGFEVWRRIVHKTDDRSERRRDELKDAIEKPKAASKCEDVMQVIEDWDTNQRLHRGAGGESLKDHDKFRIIKNMVSQAPAERVGPPLFRWLGEHQGLDP